MASDMLSFGCRGRFKEARLRCANARAAVKSLETVEKIFAVSATRIVLLALCQTLRGKRSFLLAVGMALKRRD